MTHTDELLPCPFCGDPMEWTGDFVRHVDDDARCVLCLTGFANVAAWNTRAINPDAVADVVTAAEALQEACGGEVEEVFGGEIGQQLSALRTALARIRGEG